MSVNVVVTLVMAFVVVVFSLFNAEIVTLNLIGLKKVSLPMSFLVFFVFVAGAVFAGILSIQMQIEQSMTIRRLKKKIKDLKEAPVDGPDKAADENRATRETVAKVKVIPEIKTFFGSNTKRIASVAPSTPPQVPKNNAAVPAGDPDNSAIFEKNSSTVDNEDDEDEGGLSSKLRDIALRRIQNG